VSWVKPQYACVYSADRKTAKTSPQHKRGPVLYTTDTVIVFGCAVCGGVFWEEITQERRPKRCKAYTTKGQRCKLPPIPGTDLCAVHEDLSDLLGIPE
jgi:hypothetical protein